MGLVAALFLCAPAGGGASASVGTAASADYAPAIASALFTEPKVTPIANGVTRAEFVRMLGETMRAPAEPRAAGYYSDIDDLPSVQKGYVGWAATKGVARAFWFNNGEHGLACQFRPHEQVSRAEAALLFWRCAVLTNDATALSADWTYAPPDAKDAADIPEWAYHAVQYALSQGYLTNNRLGSFRPNAALTAAEAEALIVKLREFVRYASVLAKHSRDAATTSLAEVEAQLVRTSTAPESAFRQPIIPVVDPEAGKPAATGIPVLFYHHIMQAQDMDEEDRANANIVTLGVFRNQINWLYNNGYYAATLPELEQFLAGELELPQKTVVITFDDGYRSNATLAAPILREYGYRATVFVITIGIGYTKGKSGWLGWDDIVNSSDVLDFETHTHNMHALYADGETRLSSASRVQVIRDLEKSRAILNARYLAYPHGRYNAALEEAVKAAGIKLAFRTYSQPVRRGMDPLALPRYAVGENSKLASLLAYDASLDGE